MTLKDRVLKAEFGEVVYIESGKQSFIFEFDENISYNFIDFLDDLISSGIETFNLYSTLSNMGLFGIMAVVKDGEIVRIYED